MTGVTAAEIILQLQAAAPTLPPWWDLFIQGACRMNGLSANNTFDVNDTACEDWGHGNLFVFLATYCTSAAQCVDFPASPNQARIKLVEAVPSQFPQDLVGAQPYFSFNLVINHQRTVGTGACAGCDVPVCIVLNSINVIAGTVENRFISNPSAPGGNFVSWQGGGPGCPAATPTRNATWGAVKGMYR